MKQLFQAVVAGAADLSLPQRDIQNAQGMADYDEYQLGFDIIVVQLFEFEVEINEPYYQLLEQTAGRLNIPASDYIFVKSLIRSPNYIPQPVRKKLGLLLQMLNARLSNQ
ncbi:hypothetical protein A0257_01175 [Hymenobacter psoromatis]|nr:hypothetical protein A0257_01175 [Hymenobacter psoromatis]